MTLHTSAALLALVFALPAAAELQLVSGAPFGPSHAANGSSNLEAITPDQRFVLISALANNLAPGLLDYNGLYDVFVLDRQNGTFELISGSATQPSRSGSGESREALISQDGRFVAFESDARDLVAGFIFGGTTVVARKDIFLFDRQSGTMELVSHTDSSSVTTADKSSRLKGLSSDGRFVAFESSASNLVPGAAGNTFTHIYLYDRTTGANLLVSDSAALPGTPADARSFFKEMSPDGRYLLFTSPALNLVASISDSAGSNDVFVFDRVSDTVELISRDASNPLQAIGGTAGFLSADGRFVNLDASTLLQAGLTDGNGASTDCFVFDRQSGLARLASRSLTAATVSGNAASSCGPLAQNGDTFFLSKATNLVLSFVDNNTTTNSDFFLYDRAGDSVSLVSHAPGSSTQGANDWVASSTLSPNDRYLGFSSPATNLQNGVTDANADADIFVFDRINSSLVMATSGPGNATLTGELDPPLVGTDGSALFATLRSLDATAVDTPSSKDVFRFAGVSATVRLETRAGLSGITALGSLSPNTTVPPRLSANGRWVTWDYYLWSRSTRTNTPIGHAAGDPGSPANAFVYPRFASPDGRYVTSASEATNLVSGMVDEPLSRDLFLHDRDLGTTTLLTHQPGSPLITNGRYAETFWVSDDARLFLISNDVGFEGPNLNLYDRISQTSKLIDHGFNSINQPGNYGSALVWLKSDFSVAVVSSRSWNLVPGYIDHNDYFLDAAQTGENPILGFWIRPTELFHFDRLTWETRLITRQAGTVADGPEVGYSDTFRVSSSGQDVFYSHLSDLLVQGQVPTFKPVENLFHWNKTTGVNQFLIHAPGAPTEPPCLGNTRLADITPDGRYVLFNSDCALVAGDNNGNRDAYLLDRTTSQIRLISHAADNPAVAIGGYAYDMDEDAAKIVVLIPNGPHLHFRATGARRLLTPAHFDPLLGVPATFVGATPDLSGILLSTTDSRLAPFDGNTTHDLFLFTLDELFADGFETGTTGRWSSTLP